MNDYQVDEVLDNGHGQQTHNVLFQYYIERKLISTIRSEYYMLQIENRKQKKNRKKEASKKRNVHLSGDERTKLKIY